MKARLDDLAACSLLGVALFLPIGGLAEGIGGLAEGIGGEPGGWIDQKAALAFAVVALAAAAFHLWRPKTDTLGTAAALIGVACGMMAPVMLLESGLVLGVKAPGLWIYVIGLAFVVWRALGHLSASDDINRFVLILIPVIFGVWLLYLWEILVVGFSVPQVLLPSPSQIGDVLVGKTDILWVDFQQTFLKAALRGFAIGCASGFIMALVVDRVPFLARGLLPLSGAVSAIPIVGIAPIMVMWFGFDWQSKAAVVVIMTFFPMFVNTLAGINSPDSRQQDLMRSYGASYRQTLFALRLPSAMPLVFNALKINSTLAMIGAIVAEFFGTPIYGMGFRISTEVARMNVDTVWATIAVAAVAGSIFYGTLTLIERKLTFWHPSYRI